MNITLHPFFKREPPIVKCSVLTRPMLHYDKISLFTNDTIEIKGKNSSVNTEGWLIVTFEYPFVLESNQNILRVACQINSTRYEINEKEEKLFTNVFERQCSKFIIENIPKKVYYILYSIFYNFIKIFTLFFKNSFNS